MRRLLLVLLVLCLGYLFFWPTPVNPKAWQAPEFEGLSGPHSANDRLASIETRSIAPYVGPEALAIDSDGHLITGVESGELLRLGADGAPEVVARLGGRPLGIAIADNGKMYVANAGIGLQQVNPDGRSKVLARRFAGTSIAYANAVAIAPDGSVYFTDASTHFHPDAHGGTLAASVLDLLEHDPNGRLLRYDPSNDEIDLVRDALAFPNGLAIDPSGEFLLLAETSTYRVLKVWLAGARKGQAETLLYNLPGFPDNLAVTSDGRFWLGLAAPRNALLDRLDEQPLLRKMLARLPASVRPAPIPYAHIIEFDADGEVSLDLQSSLGPLYTVTGAVDDAEHIYFASLHGSNIGILPKLTARR
ncbi:MAG: SMP-30/gluconolactonase/LRE family protein [Pseudomonadota bacterium]